MALNIVTLHKRSDYEEMRFRAHHLRLGWPSKLRFIGGLAFLLCCLIVRHVSEEAGSSDDNPNSILLGEK